MSFQPSTNAQLTLRRAQHEAECRPNDAKAWETLVKAFAGTGQLVEALIAYTRYDALVRAGQADGSGRASIERTLENCVVALSEAQAQLADAADACANFAPVHSLRGWLLARNGDANGARAAYAQALAADETHAETHYRLGALTRAAGDLEHAWPHFEACLRHDATHGPAREAVSQLAQAMPDGLLTQAVVTPPTLPTVSACLIVKNEADNLPRCLKSLQGLVDEIVVVDTGSSDDTVAIAEAFGAKIGHFEWCDDFSAARNASLDLATSDWVLVIDADEELVLSHPGQLREAIAEPEAKAYLLTIENLGEHGSVDTRFPGAPRLFRRFPGFRFEGRLHEHIRAVLERTGLRATALDGMVIRHHGYTQAALDAGDKLARNRRLAEQWTREAPKDPTAWHYLANTSYQQRDFETTVAAIEQVRSLRNYGRELEPRLRLTFSLVSAWTYQKIGQPERAREVLEEALAKQPDFPECLYERGRMRADAGEIEGAIADFEACLSAQLRPEWPTLRIGVMGYMTHTELMSLFAGQGDLEAAHRHLALAAADPACPANERARLNELAVQLKSLNEGTPVPAEPIAEAAAPVSPPMVTLEETTALLRAERWDEAREAAFVYLEQQPRAAAGFLLLATVFYHDQALDKALMAVGQSIRLNAGLASSYFLLGQILEALEQPIYAGQAYAAVQQLVPDHPTAAECRMRCRRASTSGALPAEQAQLLEELLAKLHPTVSACLIVKNEADNLPRCLKSLQGLVDEIVVVDTGSSDDTVAIAESFGAKIGHFEWCDDFSAARNASLDLATSDWVLVIDADEELWIENPEAFRLALRNREPAACMLRLSNIDDQGRPADDCPSMRIFQRLPELRYQGRLHEHMQGGLDRLGWPIYEVPARLLHHGYQASAIVGRGKGTRNVHLAELEVRERPEDPIAWLGLARSLRINEQVAESLAAYEHLETLPGGIDGLPPVVWANCIDCLQEVYQRLDRPQDAEALLDRALKRAPGFPGFLIERARLRVNRDDLAGGIEDFAGCLAGHGRQFPYVLRSGATDVIPRQALAQIAMALPELAPRIEAILQAGATPAAAPSASNERHSLFQRLEHDPRDHEAFLHLAFTFFQEGAIDKALLATAESIKLDANRSAAYHLLGLILEALNQFDYAERAYAAAVQLDPDHPTATECRMRCRRAGASGALPAEQAQLLEELLAKLHPTVSACLIVKNEADNLPRCLKSLQGLVDEIVVVDTGSSDDTVAIAESFGAKIGHFEWCDDFSAARNASLELATSDWVLVIDADEELHVEDHEAWTNALRNRVPGALALAVVNLDAEGRRKNELPGVRLFQRDPAIRYAGRVHEEIAPAVTARGLRTDLLKGAWIAHTGYDPDTIKRLGKSERNLRLAELNAGDHPKDPTALHHLAQAYMLNDRLDEALQVHARLMAVSNDLACFPVRVQLAYLFSLQASCVRLGRLDEAEAVLADMLRRQPGNPECLVERARLHYHRGHVGAAIDDLAACLAADGQAFSFSSRRGITNELPRQLLAQIKEAHPDWHARIEAVLSAPAPSATISACLIVKNEADNLPRCLKSLQGLVDEIVVVDTGSSDDTVAIAESFGAKIGHFEWCDDFSAARNASLELATSDWVLVIDADEELVASDLDAWRQSLATGREQAFYLPIKNLSAQGVIETVSPSLRMFRRHTEVRFENRLHEDVAPALQRLGWTIGSLAGVELRHYGYTKQAVEQAGKLERNYRLAKQMVEEQPNDVAAWHQLSRMAWRLRHTDVALDAAHRIRRLAEQGKQLDASRLPLFLLLEASIYAETGDLTKALASLEEGLAICPDAPEFLYERGQLRAATGDLDAAIADFEACLRAHGHPQPMVTRQGITGYLTHAELVMAWMQRGQPTKAAEHARAASVDPDCPPAEAAQFEALARKIMPAPAIQSSHSQPASADAEADLVAALEAGRWSQARALAFQVLEADLRSSTGFRGLALACLKLGELDRALLAIGQAIELDANDASSHFLLGLVLESLEQPEYAGRAYANVLQLDPSHATAMERRIACRRQASGAQLAEAEAQVIERLLARLHPTVSACLIVKNEASNLPRCLKSLQGVVDEIVVVDTGSSDDTVAIAESFGAKIGHFEWCDDFSAARNASLDLATSDWVLVIDADEELHIEDHHEFHQALRNRSRGGLLIGVSSLTDDGTLNTEPLVRLFRRVPGFRFRGRLHEDIYRVIIEAGWRIDPLEAIAIRHYGYLNEQVAAKGKHERNLRVALAEAEATPDDPAAWYNLGRIAMTFSDHREAALGAFAQVERLLNEGRLLGENRYCSYVLLHQRLLSEAGRPGAAEQLLGRALQVVPGFPEFHYERGLLRARLGDAPGAEADFRACLAAQGRDYPAHQRRGITSELPRQALANLTLA